MDNDANLVKIKFWVVTRPTKQSALVDIVSQSDLSDLDLRFKGGLSPGDVVGLFIEERAANNMAKFLLAERDKGGAQ